MPGANDFRQLPECFSKLPENLGLSSLLSAILLHFLDFDPLNVVQPPDNIESDHVRLYHIPFNLETSLAPSCQNVRLWTGKSHIQI